MSAFVEIPVFPPRSIVLDPPLTDEEFEQLSERCDCGSIERSREGTITVNPPAGSMTGDGNREIIFQLSLWWKQHRRGRVFDSNTGFFLPDGSVLSPDSAYITQEQLSHLTSEERSRFLRLAPAFVVELRSPSDSSEKCAAKMNNWIANGVELGWLIDPYARQVRIYTAASEPRIESGSTVGGSGPIAGFVLDLEEVWRCFEA